MSHFVVQFPAQQVLPKGANLQPSVVQSLRPVQGCEPRASDRAVGIFFAFENLGTVSFTSNVDDISLALSHLISHGERRENAKRGVTVNANVITRLESRRKNVAATLDHLRDQLMEVERNTEWKDLWAQRRRNQLLAELVGWYDGKLRRIDHVLDQVAVRQATRVQSRPSRPTAKLF